MYNNQCLFGWWVSVAYIGCMAGYISAGNFYSIDERLHPCQQYGDLSTEYNSSAWFDLPILLLGTFHCIAWIRVAILFCVTFLNINLMSVWYATMFNTIFGIVAYAIAIMRLFSETGADCGANQEQRAQFLFTEICISWLWFVFEFLPFMIRCKKKASLDDALAKSDDDGDEDEEDD